MNVGVIFAESFGPGIREFGPEPPVNTAKLPHFEFRRKRRKRKRESKIMALMTPVSKTFRGQNDKVYLENSGKGVG